jgi:flagellar biosynthesis/type III secretory pathway protein FliH
LVADERNRDILQVVEAADRAGSIVTEHVRSIIDGAEERAAEIRQKAEEDAQKTRDAAAQAAAAVLKRIDEAGTPLAELVADLRTEAERLSAKSEREFTEPER